jgi:DNA-binding CsgD family transcriptional regulator
MSQKKNLRADTSLVRFIDGPVIKNDPKLREHLESADQLSDAALMVLDFSARTFEHVSKVISSFVGYESQEFLNRGTPMAVAITASEEVPYLTAVQSAYVQQARVPGFDGRSLVFHEYSYTLIHHDGKKIPIISTGIVLTYGPQRQLGIGVGFQVLRNDGYENSLTSCKNILKDIKLRHNEIYLHNEYVPSKALSPKHHCDNIVDSITSREREVLGMMARGHSSSQIAAELTITTNTVESHRKKLLEKFQARNAAELIHKASKVFWLE